MKEFPTAQVVQLIDADITPPPPAKKLLVLSKYGILGIGTFIPGWHVAWGYLPKIPESVKARL